VATSRAPQQTVLADSLADAIKQLDALLGDAL
jgi:hypothetical protein